MKVVMHIRFTLSFACLKLLPINKVKKLEVVTDFLDIIPKTWSIKILGNWNSPNIKTSALERHCKENEKTTCRIGENLCKPYAGLVAK